MRAKKYLERIEKLDKMIANKQVEKQQEVQRWEDAAQSITANIGDERVQSSGDKQRMATAAGKAVDIGAEYDEQIEKLRKERKEILSVIELLETKDYEFLHDIYVKHISLKEYALNNGYSYSWITSYHSVALKKVQQILDKNVQMCNF